MSWQWPTGHALVQMPQRTLEPDEGQGREVAARSTAALWAAGSLLSPDLPIYGSPVLPLPLLSPPITASPFAVCLLPTLSFEAHLKHTF